MRRFIIFLIIIMNIPSIAYAISAKSAVLIDASSGRVLYEHNANEQMPMASTTKIMTGLLACESKKLGNTVTVSPFASGTEGSSLWLSIGEKQSLENLTYGLLLKSGNDAAVAIAEYIGGSVDAFSSLMNEKAKKAGAKNTSFKNPHGLDADGHYTTAYDLSLISREALKNKMFAKIVSTKNYTIPWEGNEWDRTLKNHNKLLWMYDGCNGVKTGFTKKSGRCLVSSAEKDGMQLICVTLNDPDDWNDHKALLDYGYTNFKIKNICLKGQKWKDVEFGKKKKIPVLCKSSFSVALREDEEVKCIEKYKDTPKKADKGFKIGTLKFYLGETEIGQTDLVTGKKYKNIF